LGRFRAKPQSFPEEKDMNDKSNYTLLGNFSIHDAKLICDVFETKNIDFEIEIDDSAIRGMAPMQAVLGGTHGRGAFANMCVDPDLLAQCEEIVKEIPEL